MRKLVAGLLAVATVAGAGAYGGYQLGDAPTDAQVCEVLLEGYQLAVRQTYVDAGVGDPGQPGAEWYTTGMRVCTKWLEDGRERDPAGPVTRSGPPTTAGIGE